MGHNFSSEPVVEKETERDHNDTFSVAVSSCQGWRTSQEDNHTLMLELPGPHKSAFFAVYDGHGSARVSKHASESLWQHLTTNEAYIKGNFKEALESSFLAFDREVNESYNAQLAGTTAVCVLVVDNVIYCANIGDSRAVASVNCMCHPLSYDHKPENPRELKRILAAGGYVLGNRVNGNLALSRAFGDFHYKGNEQLPAEQQIVSPYPDVTELELTDDVDFLVLACDGIWDVLSSEEVVEFVVSRLEQEMEPGLICEELTTRCLATDYELVIGCDNMTVLLICYTRGRSWEEFCENIHSKNNRGLRLKSQGTSESNQEVDRSSRLFDDALPPTYYSSNQSMTTNNDEPNSEDSNTNAEVPNTIDSDGPSDKAPETGEEVESEPRDKSNDCAIDTRSDQKETEVSDQCVASNTSESTAESCEGETVCKEHTIVLGDAEDVESDQTSVGDAVNQLNEAEPTSQCNEEDEAHDVSGAPTLEIQLGTGEEKEEESKDDHESEDASPVEDTSDGGPNDDES